MTNTAKNEITSKFTAIIDGQKTGLAGCVRNCRGCIRGDNRLDKSADFGKSAGVCKHFISY